VSQIEVRLVLGPDAITAIAEAVAEIHAAREIAGSGSETWPAWMGVEGASRYIGCSKGRVYKLVQRREIPYVQAGEGARLFFSRDDLDEHMLRSRIPAGGGTS
jgi:excisionase family DNA binding protein